MCHLHSVLVTATSGMGVTKMGYGVPRAGIEPGSSDIPDQGTTITPHKFSDITTIPMLTSLCSSFLERSVQTIQIIFCSQTELLNPL